VLVLSYFLNVEIFAQPSDSQDAISKTDNLTGEKLDRIIELLEQSRQGSQIALYLTIIVFLTGLAFVVFGLYIGQEHKLSLFTKRLYILAYFSLIVPVTFIIIRYIINTLLSGGWDNPVLLVAYLLLIPITASYILMVIKVKHDVIKSPPS
jgi:cellulose synthase/poly-beta-1,6-N-acetylglucosamine synthase-like glycosyltransferase